jgi:glycine/D-amino acid oxidase-like deaminating enzyme
VEALDGVVVLCNGLEVEQTLKKLPWDTNPGRTVEATSIPSSQPHRLILYRGCHLGGNPHNPSFTVGGRVNSKGEAKNDEAQISSKLMKCEVALSSEWWGARIANAIDRWPLIGWLDERRFFFAGFGGRALFWLPFCTEIAVQALLERSNQAIPEKLRVSRFRDRLEGIA